MSSPRSTLAATNVLSYQSMQQKNTQKNYTLSSQYVLFVVVVVGYSMTTAYVYSVSHGMPYSHEFPNYDQLRLHWKKQVPY